MSGETRTADVPQKRDDDSGQYEEVYPPEVVEKALREIGQGTTQDVAKELDCAYQTAYLKLRELEDDEESPVRSDRIGNVRLWSADQEADQ